MPGQRIITNLEDKEALLTARDAARDLGFSVSRTGDWEFQAQRGNLGLSIFVGAFIAYCDFEVAITLSGDDNVEINITRNTPWWTGLIGVRRVKNWAKSLADRIEEDIRRQGGEIIRRVDF